MDTKSYYVNSPINNLNYVAVGWSWNLSQIPYLYWGGDNTDSGAECVMFNIESMIDLEDKMPDIMKMNLCANWFGSLSRGHVIVECTAYKGGVIVHAWQLKNHEIDVDNRGMFIFPLADGTINMPDGYGGYKECWYGEVIKRVAKSNNEVKYFRINPVNDKIIGLDNIKIIRHGGGYIHVVQTTSINLFF